LARCALFVSNDSGAAHFARAVGVPTLVIYGSTAPARTGPAGSLSVERSGIRCRPCYRRRCNRGLECLGVEVSEVLAAVEGALSQ